MLWWSGEHVVVGPVGGDAEFGQVLAPGGAVLFVGGAARVANQRVELIDAVTVGHPSVRLSPYWVSEAALVRDVPVHRHGVWTLAVQVASKVGVEPVAIAAVADLTGGTGRA